MKTIFWIFLSLLSGALVCVTFLIRAEQREGRLLTDELRDSQQQVVVLDSKREGLQLANESLEQRIQLLQEAFAGTPSVSDSLEETVVEATTSSPNPRIVQTVPAQEGRVQEETGLDSASLAEVQAREQKEQSRRKAFQESNARYNQRLRVQYAIRKDFFSSVPEEGLTPEYQEANRQVLSALDSIELRMNELVDPTLGYERRKQLNTEVFVIARDVTAQMGKQREILLNDYGQLNLGLTPEQTQQLVEYISKVNELSSINASF